MVLSPGKIYLADQRGVLETAAFKQESTFNFQEYYCEHKQAFGEVFICNDVYIRSGQDLHFTTEENAFHLFLPITGGIDIKNGTDTWFVDTGELKVLHVNQQEEIIISNPYEIGIINYLHLGIKAQNGKSVELIEFELANHQDEIFPLISGKLANLPFNLGIGIFTGRKEAVYHTESYESGFYTFIIAGAFEIEGRLMHERDGLALWNLGSAEFEALSNNAIVLVLETLPR